MCVALLLFNISLIVGRAEIDYCDVTLVVTQFSLLAVFSWSLIEAFSIVTKIAFCSGESIKTNFKCPSLKYLVGWGVPLIITLTTLFYSHLSGSKFFNLTLTLKIGNLMFTCINNFNRFFFRRC